VLGYNTMEIGLAFLPTTLFMAALSVRFAEPLVTRFGARPVMMSGLALIALGLGEFAFAPVHANYWAHVLPVVTLLGIGAGLTFPALMTLAMSGATPEDAGLASGLVNTSAQVGGALGLAVLATVSATRTDHLKAAGKTVDSALTGGYHLAFLIGAALCLAALAVVLTVVQPEKKAAAEREAPASEPIYSEI
jgi:MFS family permease